MYPIISLKKKYILPKYIIDGYDILIFCILSVTYDSSTHLYPDEATMFVEEAEVVSQHLALI